MGLGLFFYCKMPRPWTKAFRHFSFVCTYLTVYLLYYDLWARLDFIEGSSLVLKCLPLQRFWRILKHSSEESVLSLKSWVLVFFEFFPMSKGKASVGKIVEQNSFIFLLLLCSWHGYHWAWACLFYLFSRPLSFFGYAHDEKKWPVSNSYVVVGCYIPE